MARIWGMCWVSARMVSGTVNISVTVMYSIALGTKPVYC